MPELPEVEGFARYFANHALRQRIRRVDVRDERILGGIRKDAFARALRGREFTEVRRHGKHLFAAAKLWTAAAPAAALHGSEALASLGESGGSRHRSPGLRWLHLHFGMTGDLAYYRDRSEAPRFARIVFDFHNGAHLAFEDMRLFGLADLVASPDDFIRERGLGPDPLDPSFTFDRFAALLERRRGAIKSLLMTQEILAGVGNLYADEALFQTGIHPRRGVDKLTGAEKRAMFKTLRKILRDVIATGDWRPRYLTNHREDGARCPRCGGSIRRTVVFGRTTYYCAAHQR